MVDIQYLTKRYFYFDLPVPYKTKTGIVKISPISLLDSEIFLSCFDILVIDKNIIPDPKVIQMSYLEFILAVLCSKEENVKKLIEIVGLCLGFHSPLVKWTENSKPVLYDEELKIEINHKEFEDIKKIILHQNFVYFDDEYINPELKKAMEEVDELKNKNFESIDIERKMAIITAHTGLSKNKQQEMTYRSHCVLFNEVCGEVEYNAIKPIATYAGKSKDIQWIYKEKKNRLDGYIQSVESYSKSMGGNQAIKQLNGNDSVGESYAQQFNNFQ